MPKLCFLLISCNSNDSSVFDVDDRVNIKCSDFDVTAGECFR